MKLYSFNKYFLMILILIIAASCYSVVVFAKINDDVVDMDELTKLTTTQNNTYEDKTVVAGSRGDINADGRINIRDLVMLKKRLAKYIDITVVERACDIDGDGMINIRDAVLLSKHLAGFNINFGDIATPIEPTTPIVATPIEPATTAPAGVPTITDQQTTHPDPDGPGWSDWITL